MYVCMWLDWDIMYAILFGILYTPRQRKRLDRRGMRDG